MAAATVVELKERAVAPAEKAAAEAPWPEMVPLYADHEEAKPYPIEALPPIMHGAVKDCQAYGQQPMALVACSALAAASLAAQGLADVARRPGLVGPMSLNVLVVAASGERKTTADRRMARAIRQWQNEEIERRRTDHEVARARLEAWHTKRDGLQAAIKKAAGSAKREDREMIAMFEAERTALGPAPIVDPLPNLFHEDTNAETLMMDLASGWPSAALWSDEGGIVTGGQGMADDRVLFFTAILNRTWDGHEIRRRRSTRESAIIRGRRLSVNLMMQPGVLAGLLAAGKGAARESGFLSRFLIARPPSTMGLRLYREGDTETPALQAWDARLMDLLNQPLPTTVDHDVPMVLKLPALMLTAGAARCWQAFHDETECELGLSGELSDLTDLGAKAADQAARIAGVFHVLEHGGPHGPIDEATMEAACQIAAWHLFEARRVLGSVGKGGESSDAQALLDWLKDRPAPPTLGDILRLGPYRVRDRGRRDAAVEKLVAHGLARVTKEGKSDRLVLRPAEAGEVLR